MTEREERLKEIMSELNQLIQQCERKLKERNIEMVTFVSDVMQRVDKYTPCKQPHKSPPNLITRDEDDQELKDLLGHLDMRTKQEVNKPLQLNRNIASALLTIDVKIISIISIPGFNVYDAAVSTTGDLYVTEFGGITVKKITRDNKFTDIYTARGNYVTQGITVTDTGNVLVFFAYNNSKIVEITTIGKHIRTIQYDPVDNKQLFDNPLLICTNINGDIIVTDDDKIVVVNKQG
ncbi:hypothetical protein KUTeg_000870 [Tegillarca granosa]|uniref:Uncharacterized protein n=1 Tax=Tegillarca granosa TaxID=220873 RepID=A0ABQ9FWF1_TEGGR|nr:hypothetical protein KUTeg_000870 [Tegillarca granosa]